MGQVLGSWSGLKIVWFLAGGYSWPGQVWLGSQQEHDLTGEAAKAYWRLKRTSPFHRLSKRARQDNMDAMEARLVKNGKNGNKAIW